MNITKVTKKMEIIKKISIAKTLRSMQVGDKVALSPLQVNYTSLRVAITRLNAQGWELTARNGEKNIIVERKK
jgi:hypothetical protein